MKCDQLSIQNGKICEKFAGRKRGQVYSRSFKFAADPRVRRKTTRLDDAETKNGWQRKEEHNGSCRCCHLPNILFRKCNLDFKKKIKLLNK